MDKEAQRGVEKEPLLANYCKLFHRKREKKDQRSGTKRLWISAVGTKKKNKLVKTDETERGLFTRRTQEVAQN